MEEDKERKGSWERLSPRLLGRRLCVPFKCSSSSASSFSSSGKTDRNSDRYQMLISHRHGAFLFIYFLITYALYVLYTQVILDWSGIV